MPKVNEKGYYTDTTNYRYTVSIRDKYFTNKIIRMTMKRVKKLGRL